MFPTLRRWPLLAASLLAGNALAVADHAQTAASGRAPLTVEWRFHAGSTVAGPPRVGSDGTVYIGTSEGSFEAIGLDGVLRWSVTLEGAVAWAPIQDAAGRLYVATTAQRIHSLLPSGIIGWALRPPVHIATDPVLSSWGILFGGSDGSLWAVSSRGVALWHVEMGQSASAGPGVNGRRIVVGTANGDTIFLDGAGKRFVARLGERIRLPPVVFQDGSAAVLSGSSLYRLDSRAAVLWRRDGIDWFGTEGESVYAVSVRGEFLRLSEDGTPSRNVALGAAASAPPALDRGTAFVPADSGDVLVVQADGSVRSIRVARAPLYEPIVDSKRGRLLVASGDGTLASVALSD